METFPQSIRFLLKKLQLFSCLVLMQSTQFFSGSFDLQGSCWWRNTLSLFAPLPWKLRNCLFPVSLLNIEPNFFKRFMQLISPNYAWKIESNEKRLLNKTAWVDLFNLSNFPKIHLIESLNILSLGTPRKNCIK